MNRGTRAGIIFGVVVLLFLIFSQIAYASTEACTLDGATDAYYIGPGTLYIVMQVVIGVVIGGAAMMGIYRTRVKSFFTNLFSSRRHGNESEESEEGEESA